MAGKYTDFTVRTGDKLLFVGQPTHAETKDALRALSTGFGSLVGKTHGCGCCAHEETVNKDKLAEHIHLLNAELRICTRLYTLLATKKKKA
jgi:hypothetical protein